MPENEQALTHLTGMRGTSLGNAAPLAPIRTLSLQNQTTPTMHSASKGARKPSLCIITNVVAISLTPISDGSSGIASDSLTSAPLSAPLIRRPPSPPKSPSLNPLQRLSNLASLMVYVIWFDIPLVTLLADWNSPGNRYFKFRHQCEKLLASTRLSPSVVVVGLKYLQRVKDQLKRPPCNDEMDTNQTDKTGLWNNENVIWASCLLLSHKYLDDKNYSNPVFAGVNNITAKELNMAEKECLRLLDFRLAILEDEYIEWRKSLQNIVTESIRSIAKPATPSPQANNRSLSPSLMHLKRHKPYQPPLSPGILAMPPSMWSPDSPLLSGGPLRPRQKRSPDVYIPAPPRSAGLFPPPRQDSFRKSTRLSALVTNDEEEASIELMDASK